MLETIANLWILFIGGFVILSIVALPFIASRTKWGRATIRSIENTIDKSNGMDDSDDEDDIDDHALLLHTDHAPLSRNVDTLQSGKFYEVDSATLVRCLAKSKTDTTVQRIPAMVILFHAAWCKYCPKRRAQLKGAAGKLNIPSVALDESRVDKSVHDVLPGLNTIDSYPSVRVYYLQKKNDCYSYDDVDISLLNSPEKYAAFVQKRVQASL